MPDSRIRVLHISRQLGLGGTEKVMQQFVAHLDQKRYLPAIFSLEGGQRAPQFRQLGIKTFISGDLLDTLNRFRPHIAHVHRAGWPEPELLRPMQLAKTPVVVETNVFGRHDPSPSGRVLDRTLFVSGFCAQRYALTTGIPTTAPRYSVLYNPVDTDFYRDNSVPDRDFSRPVAGRISRADPGKWSSLALDIIPILAREVPGFEYHVIGGIPEAVDYVRTHGLEKHVVFHAPVETDAEVAAFLDNVSVMAHANDTGESFGLVIAEAMACGLPVVTHPAEGLKDNAQLELVDDGLTGLVANTAEDYARAVRYLFENPDKARAMGMAGREKAQRLYRAQTVTRQLETIYQELLELKGITI